MIEIRDGAVGEHRVAVANDALALGRVEVELHCAARGFDDLNIRTLVVYQRMVASAKEHEVIKRRLAAMCPVLDVMRLSVVAVRAPCATVPAPLRGLTATSSPCTLPRKRCRAAQDCNR